MLSFFIMGAKIDKIFYNGKENKIPVYLSSGIRREKEYKVEDIDTLIENFNYAKSNDMNVVIEPSEKEGYSNILIENKKKNPFYLSFAFDNHGTNEDDGIYRYTINSGLEGLILNEKLDISYTFVNPIIPERDDEEIDKDEREKARENGILNISLSFPIGISENIIAYSNSRYKKSIETLSEEIYDISGSTDKVELKNKLIVYRKKDHKVKLSNTYSFEYKTSHLEDSDIKNEYIHTIKNSLEYSNRNIRYDNVLTNTINNGVHNIYYDSDIEYTGQNFSYILSGHIEKDKYNIEGKVKASHDFLYLEFGAKYIYPDILYPISKFGIRKNLWRFTLDSSVETGQETKFLFSVKFTVI